MFACFKCDMHHPFPPMMHILSHTFLASVWNRRFTQWREPWCFQWKLYEIIFLILEGAWVCTSGCACSLSFGICRVAKIFPPKNFPVSCSFYGSSWGLGMLTDLLRPTSMQQVISLLSK